MPQTPATPLGPPRPEPTRPAPSARRAAVPAAPGVNPLRLPRRAHTLMARSLAPLRDPAFAAWLNPRRPAVAALLCWGLDQGIVSEADVHAALDHPQRHERLYGLFCTALQALPGVLADVARRHARAPDAMPDWEPFVEIGLRDENDGAALVLTARCYWQHTLDLDALPPALAVAIAHTLDLIGRAITECVLARDLAESWHDEALLAYDDLRATGLTDLDDLWAHVEHETTLSDWYGWESLEDLTRWWAQMASFCDPETIWLRRWRAQRHRRWDPAALRRRLVRRLWRGRRRPDLTTLAWFRWLRRAVLTLSRCARRWPEPPHRAMTEENDDEAEPLAYAQMLCWGEPWEDEFLQEHANQAAGSDYAWSLRCTALAWVGLRDTLEAFAIGQGLLIGATQANDAAHPH